MNICCIQETHFIVSNYEGVLLRFCILAYFDVRVVFLSKSFFGCDCKYKWILVFTDLVDKLCMLDVTIKEKAFGLINAYAPNHSGKHFFLTDWSVCEDQNQDWKGETFIQELWWKVKDY